MAVQMYPELAVVKFVGKGKSPQRGTAQLYFVVDTWELHDGSWQLTKRYMASIAPSTVTTKLTGKE
jgi:hypothetical protein